MEKYTKKELQELQEIGVKLAEKYNEFIREYIVAKRKIDIEKLASDRLKQFKKDVKKTSFDPKELTEEKVRLFVGMQVATFNTNVFSAISDICFMTGISQKDQNELIERLEKENEGVRNGNN